MTVGELVSVAHQLRGRVRFRLQGRPSPPVLAALESQLRHADGVHHVRIGEAAASIVVEYDPMLQSVEQLLRLPVDSTASAELRARVDESILLPASPERIWEHLGDPARAPSHLPAVLKVTEVGPGTWQVTLELLGQHVEGRAVLLEEIPSERLVLMLSGPVNGRVIFSLTPEDGGTRVREQVSYDLSDAVLNWTLGKVAEPAVRRLSRQHLASLQRMIEQNDL